MIWNDTIECASRGEHRRVQYVICLNCPYKFGSLALALDILSKNDIAIEYLYAYSMGKSANIVLKPDNIEKCISVLQEHKIELVKASDLYKI